MMMQASVEDPFNFREPIRDPDLFFGRRYKVRETLDSLRSSQSVSVVGPARIGKTSLLNYVSHPRVLRDHGLTESELAFVYVDCRELADKDREQILNHMGSRIEEQVMPPDSTGIGHVKCFDDLERICRDLQRSGPRSLVIVLDAFDSLARNDHFDSNLSVSLRSLNTRFPVAYLTASEEPLDELERRYFDDVLHTSPFSNIFMPFVLTNLDEGESRALLKHYFALVGLTLSDLGMQDIVGLIVEQTAGHPYLVQWAGWHAVDIWHRHAGRWNNACREELVGCLCSLLDV
jgi:hypothetical protein